MSAPTDERLQRARERLVVLDHERAEVRALIAALEGDTGSRETADRPQTATPEGRVALFASMFRGRPDLFATRWESRTKP